MNKFSIDKSFNVSENYFNESIDGEENENPENRIKNIYLKMDDVSEIKIINKNEMICDKKK